MRVHMCVCVCAHICVVVCFSACVTGEFVCNKSYYLGAECVCVCVCVYVCVCMSARV